LGVGPQPPIPNPQSPIPNPQSPKNFSNYSKNKLILIIIKKLTLIIIIEQ
jgi:hypothetical protein